jgi:hypothetical protein
VRSSLIVALLFGAAFALLTPPFQVPDEIAHYYRACAIAHGGFWPPVKGGHGYTAVPIGEREFISSRDVPFVAEKAYVKYPLLFSPLPYLPQAAGCAIGDALHLRPLFTFYLARLMNLLCSLAVVFVAARIAAPWLVMTPALLPMSLFLFGSFSPDALTIAVTFLATTLALAGSPWVIAAAAALALCKPAYLLVPLLVFAARRRAGWIALGVVVAGAFVSTLFIRTSLAFLRPGVDDQAQIRFTLHHPLLTLRALGSDLAHHSADRVEQLVGRLGLRPRSSPRCCCCPPWRSSRVLAFRPRNGCWPPGSRSRRSPPSSCRSTSRGRRSVLPKWRGCRDATSSRFCHCFC